MDKEDDLYEIEKIVGKKIEREKIFYFVKWKNFATKFNSWEPKDHFVNSEFLTEKIQEFDFNVLRISKKHQKISNYRENMSIEEESADEYNEKGKLKVKAQKGKPLKKKLVRRKKKLKTVSRRLNKRDTRNQGIGRDDDGELYQPEELQSEDDEPVLDYPQTMNNEFDYGNMNNPDLSYLREELNGGKTVGRYRRKVMKSKFPVRRRIGPKIGDSKGVGEMNKNYGISSKKKIDDKECSDDSDYIEFISLGSCNKPGPKLRRRKTLRKKVIYFE